LWGGGGRGLGGGGGGGGGSWGVDGWGGWGGGGGGRGGEGGWAGCGRARGEGGGGGGGYSKAVGKILVQRPTSQRPAMNFSTRNALGCLCPLKERGRTGERDEMPDAKRNAPPRTTISVNKNYQKRLKTKSRTANPGARGKKEKRPTKKKNERRKWL